MAQHPLAQEVSPTGLPHDWSHRHVIYVNPETLDEAIAKGTLREFRRKGDDPRFILQSEKKEYAASNAKTAASAAQGSKAVERKKKPPRQSPDSFARDWSFGLPGGVWGGDPGNSGGAGNALGAAYPAKYSFSPIGAPTCGSATTSGDFVVFPVNVNGSKKNENLIAFNNLYTGASPAGLCGSATAPNVAWAYDVNDNQPVRTSPVISLDGISVAWVDDDGSNVWLKVLRPVQGDGTAGTFPGRTVVNNNLQILFNSSGVISGFACTSWPVPRTTPASVCMDALKLTVAGGSRASSSLFVDYINDVGFIADSNGNIFKVKDVFQGTAAPSLVWRVQTAAQKPLTSPLTDFNGHIFTVDVNSNLQMVTDVVSGTPAAPTTLYIGGSAHSQNVVGEGLLLILDGTVASPHLNDRLFAMTLEGPNNNTAVVQITTTSPPVIDRAVSIAGTAGKGGVSVFAPDFDYTYRYTATPQNGHIYMTGTGGQNGTSNNFCTLYQIGFTAYPKMNAAATTTGGISNSGKIGMTEPAPGIGTGNSGAGGCSPLTEFYNSATATDWLFVGVSDHCAFTAGNACVLGFNITSGAMPSAPTNSLDFGGGTGGGSTLHGTSGIVIDNDSTSGQASSIYFGDLNTSAPRAVKLTQGGFQ
jgi:hypothetical protein